jgi:hypothetical protein
MQAHKDLAYWAMMSPSTSDTEEPKKKKNPSAVKNFPASIETKRKDITIPSLRESGSISIPVPYEGEFLYLSHKIFFFFFKMNKDGTYGGDLMIQANCRGLNGGQVFADNGATC